MARAGVLLMSNMDASPTRDIRQSEVVPSDELERCPAMVVGVGAIGRQVALQLADLGCPKIVLVDPDHVAIENLAVQGYSVFQVNTPKVGATQSDILRKWGYTTPPEPYSHTGEHHRTVHIHKGRFTKSLSMEKVLFCCVDDMDVRKFIFEHCLEGSGCDLFIDGRMASEVMEIYSVDLGLPDHVGTYRESLFPQVEALQTSCTNRSTIYCSSIAAGLMLSTYTKYLRDLLIPPKVAVDLLAMEMESHPPCTPGD